MFFSGSNKACHLPKAKPQQGKCFAMAKTNKIYPEAGEKADLSLVDKILEIGRHCVPNNKSRIWFENLTCLWTDTKHPKMLQIKRGIPGGHRYDNFIAVSYSSEHTPGLECDRSRGYTVVEAGGRSRRESIVRDEVLTRVLRYARHNGLRRFWIDRECSPLEDDSEEKQITMDSMDLLYRESRHPIGLLAVILQTQLEVDCLQTLMMGQATVRDNEGEYPRLTYPTTSRVLLGIFDVLTHLSQRPLVDQSVDFPGGISVIDIHADIDPTRARSSREASVWFRARRTLPKCRGVPHPGNAFSACLQVGGPSQLCQEVCDNAQDVWTI